MSPLALHRHYQSVKELVEDYSGMLMSEEKDIYLKNRLEKRMRAAGCVDLDAYYDLLKSPNGRELHELIELLAVNETYFYRHAEQFSLLRRLVSEKIDATSKKTIKIWCAAAANGSEPYSIAICLVDYVRTFGMEIEIIATDIDSKALEEAEAGIFSERAVCEEMPAHLRNVYFTKLANGNFRIRDEVRNTVHFRRMNLKSDIFPSDCDIIFCRNVLIYFSDDLKNRLLRNIWNSLVPDGCLFLAPSEIMQAMHYQFVDVVANGSRCFRKQVGGKPIERSSGMTRTRQSVVDGGLSAYATYGDVNLSDGSRARSSGIPVVSEMTNRMESRDDLTVGHGNGPRCSACAQPVLKISTIESDDALENERRRLMDFLDKNGNHDFLEIDLMKAAHVPPGFFIILKRFISTCRSGGMKVSIRGTDSMWTWFEKYDIRVDRFSTAADQGSVR